MPTLTDRPTVGQSPITERQTIMATTTIPTTPAEITAWRLQRMAAVEHRSPRRGWIAGVTGAGEAILHQTPDDFGTVHVDCDCFGCKRERVETDQ